MKKRFLVGITTLLMLTLNSCGESPGSKTTADEGIPAPTPTTGATLTPAITETTLSPTPADTPPPPGSPGVPSQAYQDRLYRVDLSGVPGSITHVYLENAPSWLTYDTLTKKLEGVPTETTNVILATSISNLKIRIVVDGTLQEFGPYNVNVNKDPLKKYQWHLTNTGQTNFATNQGISGSDLTMAEAIRSGIKGSGIKVAVSDSGVEIAHPDLAANVIANASRNYGGEPAPTPPYTGDPTPPSGSAVVAGHGTAVTGIIAAVGWNGVGVRGVAPGSRFAGFRFLDSSISQTMAVYLNQATGSFDIFNYSYGGSSFYPPGENTNYASQLGVGTTNGRGSKGSLYVKAAGNEFLTSASKGSISDCFVNPNDTNKCLFLGNSNFSDEANAIPNVIVVGALNAVGTRSSYSSPGSNIWVSGFGGEYGDTDPALMTTDIQGCSSGFASGLNRNSFDRNTPSGVNTGCNYTSAMNGTSAATPTLSGVIALILEANPSLTWRDVKHILAFTATQVADSASKGHPYNFNSSNWNLTGQDYRYGWLTNAADFNFHNWYGFGRVNVDAAVAMAKTYVAGSLGTQTTTNWLASGDTPLAIPDNSFIGATSTISGVNALVVEAVQVKIQTNHSRLSDLMLELTSPSGMKSILLHYNSGLVFNPDLASDSYKAIFLSNAFYGENAAGDWKLKVIDARSGQTGNLTNWQLKIVGH